MKHVLWIIPVVAALLLVTMTAGGQSVAGTAPAGGAGLQLMIGADAGHDTMDRGRCIKCGHCPIENPNCCASYCIAGKCPKGYVCIG